MNFFKKFFGKKKDDEVYLSDILGSMPIRANTKKKMDFEGCPFCGSSAISTISCWETGGNIMGMCNGCNIMFVFPNNPTDISEVKKLWNYRPIEQRLKAEIARLKKKKQS